MNIIISDNAHESISRFFDFYAELYFRLYDDTGLGPAEEYMVIRKMQKVDSEK